MSLSSRFVSRAACAIVCSSVVTFGQVQQTWMASVDASGLQASLASGSPMFTPDGRFLVFTSNSPLVPGDSNGANDIFIRDFLADTLDIVTLDVNNLPSNGGSSQPVVTPDGRYVLFQSNASDLVAGDTNTGYDLFRRDMWTGTTVRVNVTSAGAQTTGQVTDDQRGSTAISDDGMICAFKSTAPDLVPGDTNNSSDVFVHDFSNGHTERVSVSATGAQCSGALYASLSADGRYVAFTASDDITTGDTNHTHDAFVKDRVTGAVTLCSIGANGQIASEGATRPRITADASAVVFQSRGHQWTPLDTNNADDVYRKNLSTGALELLSIGMDGGSGGASGSACLLLDVSRDARFIVFASGSQRMAAGEMNGLASLYTRDVVAGVTVRTSVSRFGFTCTEADAGASITDDGKRVAFAAGCGDLVPNDINGLTRDVFVREQPFPVPYQWVCSDDRALCPCS